MARDASTDGEVGDAIDEELGDFWVHAVEMGEGMEDWRLTADPVRVDVGPSINVRSAVEEEAGGIKKPYSAATCRRVAPRSVSRRPPDAPQSSSG